MARIDINSQLAAALAAIEGEADVGPALPRIADIYGLLHVAYQMTRSDVAPTVDPFIRASYPAAWLQRYLQKGYFGMDPIIREGYARLLPFDWSEIGVRTDEERMFFEDALRHGVGERGLSIPLTGRAGYRGLASVNCASPEAAWQDFKARHLGDLVTVSQALHQKVIRTLHGASAEVRLAPREIECLIWIAQGKDVPDIAAILELSEHTIRSYLKSGRLKLGSATLAQAIFKASQAGLLKPRS